MELSAFEALTVRRLHDIFRLRAAVFVVEQDCIYQDLDGLDPVALHLVSTDHRGVVGYTRLLPPGTAHERASAIGRVVTAADARGEGLGKAMMRRSIRECQQRWPAHDIILHAQAYLLGFYRGLGFVGEGERFLEDGIVHQKMRYAAS